MLQTNGKWEKVVQKELKKAKNSEAKVIRNNCQLLSILKWKGKKSYQQDGKGLQLI